MVINVFTSHPDVSSDPFMISQKVEILRPDHYSSFTSYCHTIYGMILPQAMEDIGHMTEALTSDY